MRWNATRSWRRTVLVALLMGLPAVPAGSEGPLPRPRPHVVPDRTLLLLEQDITDITRGPSDAVVYGGARDLELLQQIAAATRASARAQLELLRQQNEIIRLLEALGQGRASKR